FHKEGAGPIRHLDRAKGILARPPAGALGIRIFVEPFLHRLDNLLVLPPRDATLFARRALSFDRAAMARIGPITVKCLAVLLGCEAILEFLTRWAPINIFIG